MKIINLVDFLFGALLFVACMIAVVGGGNGVHAWPLIPISLALISIVFIRLKTNKGHHFGSAAWYALFFISGSIGIVEEYSYVGSSVFKSGAEVLPVITASLVLFVIHLKFWLKSKRAEQ